MAEPIFKLDGARVFVAGHRGMVGSALVRRLGREPVEVLTADRQSLDLRDAAAVDAWFARNRPDVVVMAAAKVGGIWANDRLPVEFLHDNLAMELAVIRAAFAHGTKKLLMLGSSCVYPRLAEQPIREESLLSGPLEPTNEWYAVAKIAGLKLCQAYRRQYGSDFISVMPTNLYGLGDNYHPDNSHVPAALIRRMDEAKRLKADSVAVWGTGAPRREFLYVDDLADACVHVLKTYSNELPLNVGVGEDLSIADFARLVAEVTGYEGELTFDTTRPDGAPRKLLDVSRLNTLGWRASTPLREGLGKAYADYLERFQSGMISARRMGGWRRLFGFGKTAAAATAPAPEPALAPVKPAPAAGGTPTLPKGFPDWGALVGRSAQWARRRPGRNGRVLIATNIGGHGPVSVMESTLAAALALRDAEVEIVLCDAALPGCLRAEYSDLPDDTVITERRLPKTFCPTCMSRGRTMFEPLGLKIHYLSELITDEDRAKAIEIADSIPMAEIDGYEQDGMKLGEQARAGALRYYTKGDLDSEPNGETVLRRYLEAAILSLDAYRRLLERGRYDVAVFHHGLYVPQGVVGELCRKVGLRVVNWVVAYRKNSFILSHGDTYHHTLMDEPVSEWEGMEWGDRQREEIRAYLKSRWQGGRDWIGFHEKPDEDARALIASLGLDSSKPVIGMLSNVLWDAQLHYPANAFADIVDWAVRTVDYFRGRPDLQLLLRIHPAEIRGTAPSRQPLLAELQHRCGELPANVFVIPPESPVSTYAAMEICDSALIYGTKMGVELTSVGMPVVVAGEAWIKHKGVTRDAATPEEYFAILDELPFGKPLDPDTVDRALKYAYHFFFRRMIPLSFLKPVGSSLFFTPDVGSADALAEGQDQALDLVCEAILRDRPFIYPAEVLGVHDQ